MAAILGAAEAAANYMGARGETLAARLEDISVRVQGTVEFRIHCGAVVGLTVAQVRSGVDLRHLVGLTEGDGLANHSVLVDEFDEAAKAILVAIWAAGIIDEASRMAG